MSGDGERGHFGCLCSCCIQFRTKFQLSAGELLASKAIELRHKLSVPKATPQFSEICLMSIRNWASSQGHSVTKNLIPKPPKVRRIAICFAMFKLLVLLLCLPLGSR